MSCWCSFLMGEKKKMQMTAYNVDGTNSVLVEVALLPHSKK